MLDLIKLPNYYAAYLAGAASPLAWKPGGEGFLVGAGHDLGSS